MFFQYLSSTIFCFVSDNCREIFYFFAQVDVILAYIGSYSQDVAGVAAKCVAQLLGLQHIVKMFLWISRIKGVQQILQVWKRVWLEIGEKYGVVLVLEGVGER